MPIGRGGGAMSLEVDEGEGEGFAAPLDNGAAADAPIPSTEAAGTTLLVTSLSDGWALGS